MIASILSRIIFAPSLFHSTRKNILNVNEIYLNHCVIYKKAISQNVETKNPLDIHSDVRLTECILKKQKIENRDEERFVIPMGYW